jgi:glycosidase
MRKHPHLFEVNAISFLHHLSEKYNKLLRLVTVPELEWKTLASKGFDLLWLMGVWQKSPHATEKAFNGSWVADAYNHALPNWTKEDVVGSPYAIYSYQLNPTLGREGDLSELKARLNALGLSLILDFVPNHLAWDHPWTLEFPQRFITGSKHQIAESPENFFKTEKGTFLAHGRDPYFPPWNDTVQVNYFSDEMRHAMISELENVSKLCDGVRCDMAMLVLNRIFQEVWGRFGKHEKLKEEFWPKAIQRIKKTNPSFIFMGEVYWNLEWELLQMGFDFTYDKVLYDRLRYSNAPDIEAHLVADLNFQDRLVRFIENHDEERSMSVFGPHKSGAAAMIASTLPGMRFFHDGQFEGKKIRLPVQLRRAAKEQEDYETMHFYNKLLKIINDPIFHEGEWKLLSAQSAHPENLTHDDVLAWMWQKDKAKKVITINYSDDSAQARIKVPLEPGTGKITSYDEWTAQVITYSISEIQEEGIYVDLPAWGIHVLAFN